jgi:hypothetical protein
MVRTKEHRMTDMPAISSSGTSFLATQTAKLTKAVGDAKNSFATALNRAEVTVGVKPKAGFTSGPTYEATTLAGQTKAAFNNTINAAKSALHIKP